MVRLWTSKLARHVCFMMGSLLAVPFFLQWCTVEAFEEDGLGEISDEMEIDLLTDKQMASLFRGMDENEDGQVSRSEAADYSRRMRRKIAERDIKTISDSIDVDGDGRISLAEFLKDLDSWVASSEEEEASGRERRQHEEEKFKIADADANGYVEGTEMVAVFYPETHDAVMKHTSGLTLKDKDVDGDGELTLHEFWEGDNADDKDLEIADDEIASFRDLDTDNSGKLSVTELMRWESGSFHTEAALKQVFEFGDADQNMHLSLAELSEARERIVSSDAHFHLMEWAEHEEL
eukprot:TRINITY_DN47006_c0_g1_i1.p1 TRINITY_DN47006_c0_g1~~TRINITY_DN47006_c0_g1_i1.p1  ORF type:complete len:320 (+),score=65.24 TRINITY_DN47006_c0_g1_i1:86-961(+)